MTLSASNYLEDVRRKAQGRVQSWYLTDHHKAEVALPQFPSGFWGAGLCWVCGTTAAKTRSEMGLFKTALLPKDPFL